MFFYNCYGYNLCALDISVIPNNLFVNFDFSNNKKYISYPVIHPQALSTLYSLNTVSFYFYQKQLEKSSFLLDTVHRPNCSHPICGQNPICGQIFRSCKIYKSVFNELF